MRCESKNIVSVTVASYRSGRKYRIGRMTSALPPSMKKSMNGPKRYFCGVAAAEAGASAER